MKFVFTALAVGFLAPVPSHAALMIQPASVTANAELVNTNYDINRLIDQAQSTNSYTSGATDYASYLATNPLAAPFGTSLTTYAAFFLTPNLILEFDLGATWEISHIILWNAPQTAAYISTFSVIVSNSPTFTTFTSLGSFNSNPNSGYPMTAEGFAASTTAEGRYVRITATSTHAERTLLGEVSFAGEAVPEPSGILLAGLAGVSSLFRRRR